MLPIATLNIQLRNWINAGALLNAFIAPTVQPQEKKSEQRFHLAFHRAYRRFAKTQLVWINRRFDEDFLRRVVASHCTHASATAIALAWDKEFGMLLTDSLRVCRYTELGIIANEFLRLLEEEKTKLSL